MTFSTCQYTERLLTVSLVWYAQEICLQTAADVGYSLHTTIYNETIIVCHAQKLCLIKLHHVWDIHHCQHSEAFDCIITIVCNTQEVTCAPIAESTDCVIVGHRRTTNNTQEDCSVELQERWDILSPVSIHSEAIIVSIVLQ